MPKGARLLDRFLKKFGDASAWAKRHALSDSYLSRLRRGERTPSFPMARRIERATKGEVAVETWAE